MPFYRVMNRDYDCMRITPERQKMLFGRHRTYALANQGKAALMFETVARLNGMRRGADRSAGRPT